jgi:cysteine desulfurase / selenocysteine lyase
LKFVRQTGLEAIREHSLKMKTLLLEGLAVIPGVQIYGPRDPFKSVAIVSFTIAGKRVSDIGFRLDEDFGLLTRVGLHCAPAAHRTVGSFPDGTVRLSPGIFTTLDDIQKTLSAIQEVARS